MQDAPDHKRLLLHATAVCLHGKAVLIRGPSGSGKSDLALRCLALAPSALLAQSPRLVSDDQSIVERQGTVLIVSAPPAIRNRLEVRGVGIVPVVCEPSAHVALIAQLGTGEPQERYPDPWPSAELLGLCVPFINIDAHQASAPIKLMMALNSPILPPLSLAAASVPRNHLR